MILNGWASLVAQLVKNLPAMQETPVQFLGFSCGSAGKESACNVEDLGLIPGLGRSLGEGKGLPTPVSWPREFHGLYSQWGCKESDMTGDFHFHTYILNCLGFFC